MKSEAIALLMKYILAITTTPADDANSIATALVESQLCACVNIIKGIESIYHWKGKIEKSVESILLMKTEERLKDELQSKLIELHPYDTPEFVTFTIDSGESSYLEWISSSIRK